MTLCHIFIKHNGKNLSEGHIDIYSKRKINESNV
jgi:hypothetical protein